MAISTINSSGLNQAGNTVFCTTSGNMGIGTGSPSTKVHALTPSATAVGFRAGNSVSYAEFQVDASGNSQLIAPGGTQIFNTNGSERMRIDSSGNVGIGTSSPSTYGQVAVYRNTTDGTNANVAAVNAGTTGSYAGFQATAGTVNWQVFSDAAGNAIGTAGAMIRTISNHPMLFGTNSTERMRLDSSGNLLVGTTSSADATGNTTRFSVVASGGSNDSAINVSGFGDAYGFGIKSRLRSGSSGNAGWHNRFYDSNGAVVGGIYSNGSTTSFSTSSDYRLKHDVQPLQNALARLAALNPVTYKWNADGSDGEGFIAHELAEVAPQCVTGEKDAVDAEGNPQYQGIDTSFLIATLTAAIQELKAIVDAQGAEIAALKGTA